MHWLRPVSPPFSPRVINRLRSLSLSLSLSLYLSLYLSVYLSICQSIYLYIYLSFLSFLGFSTLFFLRKLSEIITAQAFLLFSMRYWAFDENLLKRGRVIKRDYRGCAGFFSPFSFLLSAFFRFFLFVRLSVCLYKCVSFSLLLYLMTGGDISF